MSEKFIPPSEKIRPELNKLMSEWALKHAYDCDDFGREFVKAKQEFLKQIRNSKGL